ncbi:MAG: cation-translocating P-type ATPase, partial [Atopobiaceae bacterium]|nr:cation-translocating P-type ATPase [Atopobiaceae bacterium]
MKEYLSSAEDVLSVQGVSPESGLTNAEAKKRLATYVPNKLKEGQKKPLWQRFFEQLADPMIIMLLVAAVISAAVSAYQGENGITDVIIILAVVIINAVLGVVQESKAEEALAALQEMSAATSKVIREGQLVIMHSSEIVPGDIVLLEAGDAVPADCRILESASLRIEEAALTGESVPVEKRVDAIELAEGSDDIPLGDCRNMCYMGTSVVDGRGSAVVVSTGMDTEMGKNADSINTAVEELTPLQKRLDELSKILTIVVIAVCGLIFLAGFFKYGMDFLSSPELMISMFMTAVTLAVAAIPEGLVAIVTIDLSIGVTKMSERNAIIRQLPAVETLGCTQIVCSDKTGTLTQNRMTVVRHSTEDLNSLLCNMALCSDAVWDDIEQVAKGEPTEAALVADAAKHDFTTSDLALARTRIGEAPFDSGRKMMTTVTRSSTGDILQHTKGAPDEILKRCTHYKTKDGVFEMTDAVRNGILADNKTMADDALRILAVARRKWAQEPESYDPEYLEHDLTYVGLSGMIDPVRPEVKAAIDEAKSASIRTVMITGDHIDTAVAIAKTLGIINDRSQAIPGAEHDRISDEDFANRVEEFGVYARVQPEHKVRVVEAWKKKNMVVAMTGDGVNDAPSIKRADIGVGMGITGTDVTKGVADMVLADDNFATIIAAVEEGRKIYDNIRKSIQYLLSCNIAEVISVFLATMVGFTILKPIHLLWINLITDVFPALGLGFEEAEEGSMERPPRSADDGVFANHMGLDCLVQGAFVAIITLASYFLGHFLEYGTTDISTVIADPSLGAEGMTMAFLTMSVVELFHSFNMRSRRHSLLSLKKQNSWIWLAFIATLTLTFCVIEIEP